jgi:hypothetical protein
MLGDLNKILEILKKTISMENGPNGKLLAGNKQNLLLTV